jgi:hypothetical protein
MLRPLCFYRSLITAVWGFGAGVRGLGAEHSRIEGIANFLNLCGNAMPLPEFFPFSLPRHRSHLF